MAKSKFLLYFSVWLLVSPAFGEANRYIVFFTDKEGSTYSLDRPEEFLSQRALDRRENQNIPIDLRDLPVSETHIQSLSEVMNIELFFTTKWMNGILVEMDESKVKEVKLLDFVDSVRYVAPGVRLQFSSENGKLMNKTGDHTAQYDGLETDGQNQFIGVDDMHQSGYRGEGMLIAVFDSGFEFIDESSFFSHLFDDEKINATRDFIRGTNNVFQYDIHGSKVLSCISGYKEDIYVGTAPESNIVLCVTEDIESEYTIEEYNWLFAAEYADSLGVDVINSSVGYSYFEDDNMDYPYDDLDGKTTVISRAATMAASRGIIVVNSMGNEGRNSWKYLNSPADADSILSIAAANYDFDRASFSSFGPASDGRIKPDVSALGSLVRVVVGEDIDYANGTSFSSPMVAGLAAGLWQAYPHLSNIEVIDYMKMTASQAHNPDTLLGYGIVNFRRAFNRIKVTEGEVSNKYVIFPNPTDNTRIVSFYVDSLADSQTALISIYDLKGTIISEHNVKVQSELDPIELDVTFLSPGSYMLTYIAGSLEKKLKLVVL